MTTRHRTYGEKGQQRAYIDVPSLEQARHNRFTTAHFDVIRHARYVEAVEPSGRALVVKDAQGPQGHIIARTTEPR